MYKKYEWYKVWYNRKLDHDGKIYKMFDYAMNTDYDPFAIEKLVQKYSNNFVKVEEWVVKEFK